MRRSAVVSMLVGPLAATFVLSACRTVTGPTAATCMQAAPLNGRADPRAPYYIVQFRAGVDAQAEAKRLAAKYDFTPRYVWTSALLGFAAAALTPAALAGIRCEASVSAVEYDQVVSVN